jgi:hypothetical protein
MSRLETDIEALRSKFRERLKATVLPSGACLIEISDYSLVPGWSASKVTLIFVAPAGYPFSQPDCFWVEPGALRLKDGSTPQASNDSNPIPEVGPRGTWFSWHVQAWNPNRDTLMKFFRLIEERLDPPR